MRKSSSFMCVLVVLLAGGAEAQRPLPAETILAGLVALGGLTAVDAWTPGNGCVKFKDIYADGKDLIERMWGDAFNYTHDEDMAYTMWWYEGGRAGQADPHDNPNDFVTMLRNMTVPTTCELSYYHRDTPTTQNENFTECHPWHANACCHDSTVTTPQYIRDSYGAGFEWDRCGPLSQACERFFVEEACFYECDVNAGIYRRFTDEQHALCGAAAVGATVTLSSGETYTCIEQWGANAENQWELYKMPIRASYADAWYRACANDLFCGGGNYFECANDYHTQVAREEAIAREVEANRTAALAAELARLQEANRTATEAAELARLEAEQSTGKSDEKLPTWAVIIIVVAGVLAILCCSFACIMMQKEKAGEPLFTPVGESKAAVPKPTA